MSSKPWKLHPSHGYYRFKWLTSSFTPIPKKPSHDKNVFKNNRPVSNIPFLSKLVEKIVAHQLTSYLTANSLLEPLQSAYRKFHSTETALLKVHNDICLSVDSGNYVLLILLDLSAAFDTIDHKILLQRLSHLGISGIALKWCESYLKQRNQSVNINNITTMFFFLIDSSVCSSLYITIQEKFIFCIWLKHEQISDVITLPSTFFNIFNKYEMKVSDDAEDMVSYCDFVN